MNGTYQQRALACVERALAGLGLLIELDAWDDPEAARHQLVVVVRGSCALSTVEIQDRGLRAFEEEFSDCEPWPLLGVFTNGDRELPSRRPLDRATS